MLQVPLIVYGSNLIATSFTSQLLWIYVMRKKLLSSDSIDEKIMSKINRRLTVGPLAYVFGIAFSFIDTQITLIIYIGALLFLIVNSTVGYRTRHPKQ
jgi:hypothetical protein